MRNSTDNMLALQVEERYVGRMTERAVALLDHPSTELYLGLYKRGYWMFKCSDTQEVMAVRQTPSGYADDIRIRAPDHNGSSPWTPVATRSAE
jgi:hypothetical protein